MKSREDRILLNNKKILEITEYNQEELIKLKLQHKNEQEKPHRSLEWPGKWCRKATIHYSTQNTLLTQKGWKSWYLTTVKIQHEWINQCANINHHVTQINITKKYNWSIKHTEWNKFWINVSSSLIVERCTEVKSNEVYVNINIVLNKDHIRTDEIVTISEKWHLMKYLFDHHINKVSKCTHTINC